MAPDPRKFIEQYGKSTPFIEVLMKGMIDAMDYKGDDIVRLVEQVTSGHQQNPQGGKDTTFLDSLTSDIRDKVEPVVIGITGAWQEKYGETNGFVNFLDPKAAAQVQTLMERLDDVLSTARHEGQVGLRQ